MDTMDAVLKKTLAKKGLLNHAEASVITYRAQEWLHRELEEFKDAIAVTKVKDGTVHVRCSHSIASQECAMQKQNLLDFLHKMFGEKAVREVLISRS